MLKSLNHKGQIIKFPTPTQQVILEAVSDINPNDTFKFFINRKGQYNLQKCTYLSRYKNIHNLLRIDIEGPPHDNPDGTTVQCPHIHIYKEGYNLSWAYPLPDHLPTDPTKLIDVLIDFLSYNNVKNVSDYSYQEGGLI